VRANLIGPAIDTQLRVRVEAKLLPGVLQTLALLQTAHSDIEGAVATALRENPMLERHPGHPCPGCGRHIATARCRNCTSHGAPAGEPTMSPFETLGVLAGCEVAVHGRRALPAVLDHLTDRGLLDADPDEIADAHDLDSASVSEAVRAIKAVGPPGIAERSVPELLAAQARQLVCQGDAPAWILPLVRESLELVARNDVEEAARLFGTDHAAAEEVFSIVRRRLRPFADPGSDEDNSPRRAPDVYVRRDESGSLEIESIDSRWFGLRLCEPPDEIRADHQAWQWLQQHEQAARTLLTQLDARASVLNQVAAVAVRRQKDFLDRGPAWHVPLTRSDVARELGIHPSTVARAVSGKVIRTPSGKFIDFKDLFGSAVAVRAEIADLLAESTSSDAQLCVALQARGYSVARRTVAKYRAQLGIPAANRS